MKIKAFGSSVKILNLGNQEINICFYHGVQWPAQLFHADSSTLSDVLNKHSLDGDFVSSFTTSQECAQEKNHQNSGSDQMDLLLF